MCVLGKIAITYSGMHHPVFKSARSVLHPYNSAVFEVVSKFGLTSPISLRKIRYR